MLLTDPLLPKRFERVLLLNATYEPLLIITWQRSMILLASEKAEVLEPSLTVIHGVGRVYPLPSMMRLLKRVRPRRDNQVRFSRRNVYVRDKYRCQYCGVSVDAKEITCDHVIPRSRGGKTTWENTVAACHRCNLKKADRLPDEVGMRPVKTPTRPAKLPTITTPRYPQEMPDSWRAYLENA